MYVDVILSTRSEQPTRSHNPEEKLLPDPSSHPLPVALQLWAIPHVPSPIHTKIGASLMYMSVQVTASQWPCCYRKTLFTAVLMMPAFHKLSATLFMMPPRALPGEG